MKIVEEKGKILRNLRRTKSTISKSKHKKLDLNVRDIRIFLIKIDDRSLKIKENSLTGGNELLKINHLVLEYNKINNKSLNVDDFLTFATNSMTTSLCEKIFIETVDQHESTLWFDLRHARITASRIHEAARCTMKNGSLVNNILGKSRSFDNYAMKRGRNLEKQVVGVVEKKLGIKLENSGLQLDPKYPIFGASPDALNENVVIEIKCPLTLNSENNYITTDKKICAKPYAQIQFQMFMSKREKGYFCMARHDFEVSRDVIIIPVDLDEKFVLDLVEKCMEFWKKSIFPRITKKYIYV